MKLYKLSNSTPIYIYNIKTDVINYLCSVSKDIANNTPPIEKVNVQINQLLQSNADFNE
jgi:hypothetical protein